MPYLIDGHNLIPKLGLHLDSPDDEMQLIGIIQEFARLSRRDTEIYFDGAPVGQAHSTRFGMVTVHFIRAGSSADTAIKTHINRLGRAARNWTVVTSDRDIQTTAREAHARVLSSEEFAAQVQRLQRTADRPGGDSGMTPQELAEWLKLFGDRD